MLWKNPTAVLQRSTAFQFPSPLPHIVSLAQSGPERHSVSIVKNGSLPDSRDVIVLWKLTRNRGARTHYSSWRSHWPMARSMKRCVLFTVLLLLLRHWHFTKCIHTYIERIYMVPIKATVSKCLR